MRFVLQREEIEYAALKEILGYVCIHTHKFARHIKAGRVAATCFIPAITRRIAWVIFNMMAFVAAYARSLSTILYWKRKFQCS